MSAARTQGRAASCTSTKSSGATSVRKVYKPASTESARSSPPSAISTSLPPISAWPGQCGSLRASTTTIPPMRGCAASRSSVSSSIGVPAMLRYCLGSSPPKRAPRPAAGTTHQRAPSVLVTGILLVGRRRLDDLVERLARLDEAELRTRALFDRFAAVLQVFDLRRERLVALAQAPVLFLLFGEAPLESPHIAHAALPRPEFDLEREQQHEQDQRGVAKHGASSLSPRAPARWGTRRARRISPRCRALPRCAAVGCTWRRGRCGTANPS